MLLPLFLAVLASDPLGDDPGYVLHEWGTFTTLMGSDGVLLEGLTYDDHQLPDFVHRRSRSPQGFDGVRCKMETPVIYFYSDRERQLSVEVAFQRGVMTQWYPEVRELYPAVAPEPPVLRGGLLDWGTIHVLAPGKGLGELPAVGAAQHWEHARAVDANVILKRTLSDEHERFLFYRGLGSFAPPLATWTDDEGALVLSNAGAEPLAGAIVLARHGARLHAKRLGDLTPGQPLRVVEGDLPRIELSDLMALTRRMLEEQGLYAREAEAMVNTWQQSYFETDGLRVLYPLPRAETDWLLPLHVTPAPREIVRVMVGRTDVLTREMEQQALAALPNLRTAEDALRHYGRFALPLTRRLVALADEGRERDHALELVELLEQSD